MNWFVEYIYYFQKKGGGLWAFLEMFIYFTQAFSFSKQTFFFKTVSSFVYSLVMQVFLLE